MIEPRAYPAFDGLISISRWLFAAASVLAVMVSIVALVRGNPEWLSMGVFMPLTCFMIYQIARWGIGLLHDLIGKTKVERKSIIDGKPPVLKHLLRPVAFLELEPTELGLFQLLVIYAGILFCVANLVVLCYLISR